MGRSIAGRIAAVVAKHGATAAYLTFHPVAPYGLTNQWTLLLHFGALINARRSRMMPTAAGAVDDLDEVLDWIGGTSDRSRGPGRDRWPVACPCGWTGRRTLAAFRRRCPRCRRLTVGRPGDAGPIPGE